MNKRVSNIQMGMLLSLTICGYFLGMSDIILLRTSKSEVLVAMLLGTIIGLVPLLMYLKINNTYQNLNIYEKVIKLFGKKLGFFINLFIIISYISVFCIAIRTIISFMTTKYLESTPYFVIGLLVVISCLIAVFKGLEAILRLARISYIITVIFAFFIETIIFGYVDIDNIIPIFASSSPVLNIINGSLYFAASTSLLSILLLSIKKDSIRNNKNYNKTIVIFYLSACFSLITVMFFIVACYGYKMASLFRYPEYVALKKIGFSSSELHLENLLAFRWVFYSLALSCVSLYGIESGIKVYSRKIKLNKILLIVIAIFSILISKWALGTVPSAIMIMKKYYALYAAAPMFTLLSLIFIRCLFVKNK